MPHNNMINNVFTLFIIIVINHDRLTLFFGVLSQHELDKFINTWVLYIIFIYKQLPFM